MKILHLSPRYRAGGAERSARDLFHSQIERGHTVSMWTAVPENGRPVGVECVRTFPERLLYPVNYIDPVADWRHLSTRRRIDAISPTDFDVVHLHNIHGHWLSIKAISRLCQRMPVVWSLRDGWAAYGGLPHDLARVLDAREIRELKKHTHRLIPLSADERAARKWSAFLKTWMPQPTRLLCPSRWIQDMAEKGGYFHQPEFRHIPNGVMMTTSSAIDVERTTAKQSWGFQANGKVVLLIAADIHSPYKGMRLAAETLKIAAEQNTTPDFNVLLLGNNADSFPLELPGNSKVVRSFAKTEEELARAYRAADVTLVPSIAEQFGLVAAESLACETPIVCFNVGGLAEIAGNNERGIRVPILQTDQMADGIQKLLSDKELNRRLGTNGKRWVFEHCEYNRHVDRTIAIYDEAIQDFSRNLKRPVE